MFRAKVIPLTRLPRPLGVFDYQVPKELEKKIRVGQLVITPWRQSEIFGLVFSIDQDRQTQIISRIYAVDLKRLSGLVHEEPLVSKSHLDFLYTLSQWYGVSLATLAQMSLLPLQKKKLKKLSIIHFPHLLDGVMSITGQFTKKRNDAPPIRYHLYHNQKKHIDCLKNAIQEVTLILVPEIHLIDEIHRLLPLELQWQTVIWHSQLTTKKQFERWLEIRNSEKTIILGTRGAVFLPIPNLKTIIIDYEHDENHKHWDHAPRFHVKDIAPLLAQITGAALHLMSFSAGVESYYYTMSSQRMRGYKSIGSSILCGLDSRFRGNDTHIIDLHEERRAGRFGIIADEIKEAILETYGDMFLFINRLGFSTSIGCNGCGNVARCERCQLPLIYHQKTNGLRCHYCQTQINVNYDCPRCQNRVVQLRGAGTEFVEVGVRNLFRNHLQHEIIRLDSERKDDLPYTNKPRIIVGTGTAFRHVRWEKTDLIVYVGIDSQLALPEYRATAGVWHAVQEMIFRKSERARLYIQTFNPDHLLFKSLREPDRFYRTELGSRRALDYPPYQYLVRYFYGNRDARLAQREAERVFALLKSHLTKEKKSARISQAIEMHPRFYRNQFWYVIIVKLNQASWQENLVWLNQFIPVNWKIDPNPISLLSP